MNLAASFANSAAFQAWTRTADAAAAGAHIWINRAPADADRPLVEIQTEGPDFPWIATGNTYGEAGAVVAIIEATTPDGTNSPPDPPDLRPDDKSGDAWLYFDNEVDAVLKDIETQTGTAGRLAVSRATMEGRYVRSTEAESETATDYFQAHFRFEFTDGEAAAGGGG